MKIEFVNHASFIYSRGDVRMIADPWLEGTAFDKGWGLLAPVLLPYEGFKDITHIWFSHEHPDHFHPPTLKRIPAEHRAKITILFQETADKKVMRWCRDLGFQDVIELKPTEWYALRPDLELFCKPFGVGDSWLAIKGPEGTVLNINDCEIATLQEGAEVKKIVGDVDVLFTQFSYAGWAGNKEDVKTRRERAKLKIDRMKLHVDAFRPKYVIPFASFVWFCHEENFYMNDGINRIGDVYEILKREANAEPVILYPGDVWSPGAAHSSEEAVARYNEDYERVLESPDLIREPKIEWAELEQSGCSFVQKLNRDNNGLLLKMLIKPIVFYVTDHEQAVRFSREDGGIVKVDNPYEQCDIALSSEALNYCLNNLWGWSTLRINGRFQAPKGYGHMGPFIKLGHVASLNNAGLHVGWNPGFIKFAVDYALKRNR